VSGDAQSSGLADPAGFENDRRPANPPDPSADPSMRNDSIDAARFLSFVGVVVVHCFSSHRVFAFGASTAIDAAVRFAVPVFFLITGYLLHDARGGPADIVRRYFVRLVAALTFWEVAFHLIDAVVIRLRPEGYRFSALPKELGMILYTGGFPGHLWFLPWLFVSVALFVVARRRLSPVGLAVAGAVSLALGLAIGPYNVDVGLWPLVERHVLHPALYDARDTPFFGFALLVVGHAVAVRGTTFRPGTATLLGLAAAGYLLQLVEARHIVDTSLALGIAKPWRFDILFGTMIYSAALFLFFLTRLPTGVIRATAELGRRSLGMYCVHGAFLFLYRRRASLDDPPTGIEEIAARFLLAAAIVVASAIVASLLARLPWLRRFVH
jgi:surface polysaccharide O-acyltransferase-like enzyme